MARFRYRMQNILNIKEKLESQAKNEYAQANMELAACMDVRTALLKESEALMEEMLRLAAERDAKRIFLEVRAHNEPAKALYRKRGFIESYRRRNYYQGPTEDAIIMMKE